MNMPALLDPGVAYRIKIPANSINVTADCSGSILVDRGPGGQCMPARVVVIREPAGDMS